MFSGSIPALVTPFKNGAFDRSAFAALVERQISGGSSALVPCGTTGESATLSHEEHRDVVTLCVDIAAGRVPVIAGAGSNSTAEAVGLIEHAHSTGADAAMVVCPYYNKPDQAGLEAHFRAVAGAAKLPIILYNVPSRTGCDLLPETVGRLASTANIVGIKDASGSLSRVSEHNALTAGHEFTQICGDDPVALGHRAMGGAGCISVTANVAPQQCAAMHAAFDEGDLPKAREIESRLNALHHAMFVSPSPGPAKYVLAKMGLCAPDVRLPITPARCRCRSKDRRGAESSGCGGLERAAGVGPERSPEYVEGMSLRYSKMLTRLPIAPCINFIYERLVTSYERNFFESKANIFAFFCFYRPAMRFVCLVEP